MSFTGANIQGKKSYTMYMSLYFVKKLNWVLEKTS